MVSIIITTKREPKTLAKTIEKILEEDLEDSEILVVGPDEETEKIVKNYPSVKYLKDKGVGKPAALNLAFQQARGDILILTDGDVCLKKYATAQILRHFEDEKVGAVSGHPVSINSRGNIFGYWSHFLTAAADYVRKKKSKAGEYLVCSGYLYAIRNLYIRHGFVIRIPENTLVEDSIISQMIWQKGYGIAYEPEAKVYVKYPDNFSDWLKQKIRATGGYVQKSQSPKHKTQTEQKMRGFWEEVKDGIKLFFTYPKNFKEFWWTILLYLARLYLWLLIFWQIKVLKKTPWPRVESTK